MSQRRWDDPAPTPSIATSNAGSTQNIGSHWATCWKDSSEHWECAVLLAEQALDGLSVMFWKVPIPSGCSNDDEAVAKFWVDALADEGILVKWNSEEGQFDFNR